LLALIASLAAWYALDFEDDVDPEFPAVVRPTFGNRPSPAYRLAEPGDTLDRVGIYLGAGATVVAAFALIGSVRSGRDGRRWLGGAGGLGRRVLARGEPQPYVRRLGNGWGWRAALDPTAPWALRAALAVAALAVVGVVAWPGLVGASGMS